MEHPENDEKYAGLHVNAGVSSNPTVNPYRKVVKKKHILTSGEYVEGILKGDVSMLGRAVTLIESTADAHQAIAQEVIEKCLPYSGNPGASASPEYRVPENPHRSTFSDFT